MVDAAYLAIAESAQCKPIDIVEIDLPGDSGTVTFRFASADPIGTSNRLGIDLLPYVVRANIGSTTRIMPSDYKTQRGSVSIEMRDDENPEGFDSGDTELISGSTFWRRLFQSFPDWHRSEVRVLSFFDHSTMTSISQAEPMFAGLLEDYQLTASKRCVLTVRDKLEFQTTKAPVPISSGNILTSGITSTTASISVSDESEFIDAPNDFPSSDFWLPTVKIESELIAYRRATAGTVRCARNRILKHSEFENAAWAKQNGATVSDGAALGPRGIANGALLTLPNSGYLQQTSPSRVAASNSANGSIYVKEHPDDPGITVDIRIQDAGATESAVQQIILKPYWQRVDVGITFTAGAAGNARMRIREVGSVTVKFYVAEGSLAPNTVKEICMPSDSTEGSDLGRGAFGTVAVAHSSGVAVIDVAEYKDELAPASGLHPVAIIRDLLNRSGIDPSDIDQEAFDSEAEFSSGDRFLRSIESPQDAKQLVTEVRQQALIDLWANEESKLTVRLSWRTFSAGEADETIDEDFDIIDGPPSLSSNKASRITRPEIHWGFVGASEGDNDNADVYSDTEIRISGDGEGPGFRSRLQKAIFSKWIYRTAEAESLQNRLIQRFTRGARMMALRLSFQRFNDIRTGQLVRVRSKWLVRDSGGSAVDDEETPFQVVSRKYSGGATDFDIVLLEHILVRPGFIAPNQDLETPINPFPDYDDASDAERYYGFIANDDDPPTIPTEGGSPYVIQ